jgi:hypothetical protein
LERQKIKDAADKMLDENDATVQEERRVMIRNLLKSSFAEKMFNADLEIKDRISKYSTIDPDRVFGDEKAIDNCLEFLDQDLLGENALIHGYDLYRDVN